MSDTPRDPAIPASQDAVVPFHVPPLDIRGRAVQLGSVLDDILNRHNYPDPVSALLAEVMTMTVLLGTSLKFDGKFIVQTKTDGPVSTLMVDFRTPGSLRAYAQFDAARVAEFDTGETTRLIGNGILAMTIDQGPKTRRYQGIVQLQDSNLEQAARQYFRQSEQIPTEIRLAVARSMRRSKSGSAISGWRAGGVIVQFLPQSAERVKTPDLPGGDHNDEQAEIVEDNAWLEATSLMSTISDVELVDADIPATRLLYRLFNEHGVRAFEPVEIKDNCSCSRDTIQRILRGLSEDEITESTVNGHIEVNCEFCNAHYRFDRDQLSAE